MENKINIAEILKDCPKGMKLYSLIYGEVELSLIDDTNDNYPICIKTNLGSLVNFTKDGRYAIRFPTAECLLFPSSEMRDWTKFFKRGDVIINIHNGCGVLFEEWVDDSYTSFKASICQLLSGKFAKRNKNVFFTKDFDKASDEQRDKFIADMKKYYGGKYNPETLQVESVKPECPFKPFDKVLVRDEQEDLWYANFFAHYNEDDKCYPYSCIGTHYRYCIPYNEHTAHLLGTTDPYTEGGME